MESTVVGWGVGLYIFVMLITLGHFYRRSEKLGLREVLAILAAPVWWIVAKGVTETLRTMGEVVYENHILWAVGFIAVGHYLASTAKCSTALTCTILGAKAVFLSLPPVALVYWGYVLGVA
jgi:hypothetical protein